MERIPVWQKMKEDRELKKHTGNRKHSSEAVIC